MPESLAKTILQAEGRSAQRYLFLFMTSRLAIHVVIDESAARARWSLRWALLPKDPEMSHSDYEALSLW